MSAGVVCTYFRRLRLNEPPSIVIREVKVKHYEGNNLNISDLDVFLGFEGIAASPQNPLGRQLIGLRGTGSSAVQGSMGKLSKDKKNPEQSHTGPKYRNER